MHCEYSSVSSPIARILGHKASVHIHQNYLVIISPPFAPSASAASATVRRVAFQNPGDGSDITKVVVFDPENKLVAYTGTSEGIREVFSANGQIYLLSNDGKVAN